METFKLLTALGWRNLWRNKRRTGLTFIAIGVGVWSMIFIASLTDAWSMSTFHASIKTLLGHGQIHAEQYLDDPSVEYRMQLDKPLRAALDSSEISHWSARVRVSAIVQSERENTPR